MNVFLDIGAGIGAVTREALAGGFGIERAYCFEPQAVQCARIAALQDPRITVCPFALGKRTGHATLYRGGTLNSASLYATKRFSGAVRTADCEVVSATEWFREHLNATDHVVAGINAEGGEVDILEDLAASGEIRKLHGLAVIFDIRKVPPERHREAHARELLAQVPKVFVMAEGDCGFPARWLPQIL